MPATRQPSHKSDRPLNIMHIASGDLWAGAENQIYYLICQLQSQATIQTHVILLNEGILADKLRTLGANVTILDETRLNTFVLAIKLTQIVHRIKPDIIHSHRIKENVLGGIASLLVPQTRCITTIHGAQEIHYSIRDLHKKAFPLLEKFTLRFIFKKIVFVSYELHDKLSTHYSRSKSAVIENGIDIEETLNRASLTNEETPGNGKIKVALLGRIVDVKRADIFIQIAEELIRRHPDRFTFYIIGDGPLYNETRHTIEAKKLNNDLVMTGFAANPLPLLKKMHYLLITSDHEGLPTNLLEAMCLKVPVISHHLGGIAKVLIDGELGTLIKNQDYKDYADAIEHCETNKKSIAERCEKAFTHLQKNYSSAKTAELYLREYLHLSKPPQQPANPAIPEN